MERVTSLNNIAFKLKNWFENRIRSVDGNKEFYETADLGWVQNLEAQCAIIQAELHDLIQRQSIPDWQSISDDPSVRIGQDWKTFVLFLYGEKMGNNCATCPKTTAIIESIPIIKTAWFSILEAGREIPPHYGPYNGVLRYHLGLYVPKPEKCGIEVGESIRHWEEGKSLLFDDTHLHWAWNRSDKRRIILFVDVVRPLPFPYNWMNRLVIQMGKSMPFVQNLKKKLDD